MSLVSEALRKARAHSGRQRAPGESVPPSLVLPPRRNRTAPRIGALLLVALVAGAAGALVVFWTVRRTAPAQPRAAGGPAEVPAPTIAPGVAAPSPARAEAPAERPSDGTRRAADGAVAAPAPSPTPPPTPTPAPALPRTVEALVDADLGYARLHLDFLVFRPGSPFGRVNGQDVVIGSIVDGFTVQEITADFIKVADRRHTVLLRVR